MRQVQVYAIIDARNGEIKYVGKAHNPKLRFLAHLRDTKTLIGKWIDGQIKEGYMPKYIILENTNENNATDVERKHILLNKETALNLVPVDSRFVDRGLLKRFRVVERIKSWKFSKIYNCITAGQALNSFLIEFGCADDLAVEVEQ